MSQAYTLIYWGGLPGRGEFIRLPFEYTNTTYKEVNDPKQIVSYISPKGQHFAPPILDIDGTFTLSQTPAILAYLGPKLGLSGSDDMEHTTIHQLTLTALDLSSEAHNVHHPISAALYYEDQKIEAIRCAENFRKSRIPKFLTHFEAVLAKNGTGVLVGSKVSIADLTIFQVLEGLAFAFPKRMGTLKNNGSYTALFALRDRVGKDLEGYLKSGRRLAFSNGIFRHYPELDAE